MLDRGAFIFQIQFILAFSKLVNWIQGLGTILNLKLKPINVLIEVEIKT